MEPLRQTAAELDRYLSIADLRQEPFNIKLHRETLRRMMAKGAFPRPVNLTGTDNRFARRTWKESEVLAWKRDREENGRKSYTPPAKSAGKAA